MPINYETPSTVLGVLVPNPEGYMDLVPIRAITPDQVLEITKAINYCRKYANRAAVQQLNSSYLAIKSLVEGSNDSVVSAEARDSTSAVCAEAALFIRLWRPFFDHTCHDLSQRFGKESEQYRSVVAATQQAYDNHFGYRLIDGLRNYVEHVAPPPLSSSSNIRLGKNGGASREEIVITLHLSPLLEYLKSRKEKKLLQDDLRELDSDEISFMELLDDAMEGVSVVVAAVSRVDEPQLQRCISLLQGLVREAAPHFPELITIPSTLHDIVETSTFDIQSVTFYDLADLLLVDQQNYPRIELNSRVQIKFTAKRALIDKLQNFKKLQTTA